jgi:hypothetical protein
MIWMLTGLGEARSEAAYMCVLLPFCTVDVGRLDDSLAWGWDFGCVFDSVSGALVEVFRIDLTLFGGIDVLTSEWLSVLTTFDVLPLGC